MAAIAKGTDETWRIISITFKYLGKLVTGNESSKQIGGAISIAKGAGDAASSGVMRFATYVAFLSVSVGLINLFPIPILDGGVIALLAIEGLIRRDLSLRLKERIFQAGFIFLILLMSIVIFNDIAKNI